MPWTEQQCEQVHLAYWKQETPPCPVCQSPCSVKYSRVNPENYSLAVSCPQGHGSFVRNKQQDPMFSSFRDFRRSDIVVIIQQFIQRGIARCTVDCTLMDISTRRPADGGKTQVTAVCPRCCKVAQGKG